MEIQSKLTRWDYAKLLVAMMLRRTSMIMAGGILAALLVFSFFNPSIFYLALGYLVIMVLLYSGAIFYTTHKRANRYYFLAKEYHFNSQGVFVKTPAGNQQLKWEEFMNWKKLSGFFVLYITNHSFIAIPQADVPSGEKENFVSLLLKNIKQKKQ